ncbi:hypothetical protein [Dinoroseobacter shibae]|jgi:hypothetical protein|uniref:hypothetical protein n=1 Tax=Dinoroseobacter shibae TaxID=215813 RepID=UPI0000E93F1B|nr:hypothetical protein [Dinoroseobacter shibae]URF47398.1 hypothetical protein M8008_03670 [Dinoroseobacter shibae]URF51709.1 hypothetical protein M8007_03670 [Dinoroseobacter shibae]
MIHENFHTDAAAVLALKDDDIGEFLREQIARKRLSQLVQSLNNDVLDGSAEAAQAARRALSRLGFVDDRA